MKQYFKQIWHYLFHDIPKKQLYFLIAILVCASFLRLYNIKGSLMFQGDQGRDALIVADIFRKFNLVFIGPVTSVGNMYLGPLYYYFMLPFLLLTYPSPLGPAYAIAFLSIITVYLVYKIGRILIGDGASLLACIFFTFSSTVVYYSRFSWNPNPAPLVSLLMIFYCYKALKEFKYWPFVAICFSILIQLHYLTLLSLAPAGLLWLMTLINLLKSKSKKITQFTKYTIISLLIFLISLVPLILFDLKHNFNNSKAFFDIFAKENTLQLQSKNLKESALMTNLKETEGRTMHILFEYMIGQNRSLNQFLVYAFLIIFLIAFTKEKKYKQGYLVIILFLLTAVFGTSFYKNTIYNHYIAYLFPVTAYIYGIVLSKLCQKKLAIPLVLAFTFYFFSWNYSRYPLKTTSWTIDDVKQVASSIALRVTKNQKYNIVLLSESKDLYGQNYRYYLSTMHTAPVDTYHFDSAEILFIINEVSKNFNPNDSDIYEIKTFSPAEVVERYQTHGPEIIMLKKL